MFPVNYNLTEAEQTRIANANDLTQQSKIGELISMLADPSWVVRRSIVESLAAIGAPAAAPLCQSLKTQRDNEARIAASVDTLVAIDADIESDIYQLTQDDDPAVVADGAQVLGRRGNPAAAKVLIDLINHKNDNVAVVAIEGLGRIGGRAAVEALITTVRTENFFRTFPAIDVLGRSGDPRVVEPLTQLLKNPSYLPEAARALGRTGEKSAVKPLVKLLSSPAKAIVRVAAASLWELRDRFEDRTGGDKILIEELIRNQTRPDTVRNLIQVMTDADPIEAVAYCRILEITRSPEALPALTEALNSPEPVASCAAEALKKIGAPADEPLIHALRTGPSPLRKILLKSLTRSSAAHAAAECLDDPDSDVRVLACDALARLGNISVVPKLYPLLNDNNMRVVHSATAAIQALGSSEARDLAVEASRSNNPVVRRSALRILSYLGGDKALQPLLEGLGDSDSRVCEAALQGLPYLEDARAIEALIEASRSTDSRIRALATRSLGQVPRVNERILSILLKGLKDSDPWVRYYSCQSLGRAGYSPATPEITKLLEDDAGQVRVSAVEALSHMDSPESHQALKEAASSDDLEVRRAALIGLGIAARPDGLPIVLSALESTDGPTRLMALGALVNFKSPSVLTALSAAATDSDEQVSSTAIGFLGGRSEQEATEVLIDLLKIESTQTKAKEAMLVPRQGRASGILVALESADDELASLLVSILARLDRSDARKGLLAAMKLNNEAARKAAASGIAARRDPEMRAALQDASENDPSAEVRQISSLLLRG